MVGNLEGPNVPKELVEFAENYEINTVYEIGSRDALDGMYIASVLEAKELHIFEPNAGSAKLCSENILKYDLPISITVNECAVSDTVGPVNFYPVDTVNTQTPVHGGNPGASSMFNFNREYPYENIVQKQSVVHSETLDNYCKTHLAPDLMWIDAQGAELMILKGGLETLSEVNIIFTEVCFKPIYLDQPLFWEIDKILKSQGFDRHQIFFGRAGTKKKIKRWLSRQKFSKFLPDRFWAKSPWFTDAIYIRNH